jgi:hypothetical protein
MIKRRALIGLPFLAASPARPVLSVGASDRAHLEASLWLPSGAVFTCPPTRTRLVASVRLRAMEVAAVSFAFDVAEASQELLALVGPDGRLLALERLRWKTARGDALETHFAMLPDRVHLTLERSVAIHDGGWRREAWTDYLALAGARLVNRPPREVLAGTWQARMSRERGVVADTLRPMRAITRADCAAFWRVDEAHIPFEEPSFGR